MLLKEYFELNMSGTFKSSTIIGHWLHDIVQVEVYLEQHF